MAQHDRLEAQEDPFDMDIGEEDEEDEIDEDEDHDDDEEEEGGWQVGKPRCRLDLYG